PRGGIGERLVQPTKRVHQPALLRLRAGPHAAARDFVDLLDAAAARLRDLAGEVAVALLDDSLHGAGHAGVERAGDVEGAGVLRGGHAVGVHAELAERAVDGREQAEDADRTGDGRRIGVDAVGVHADPVAAGRGLVAHRHHYRLAGVLQ